MAVRLNSKFLIIIMLAVCAAGVVVGGLWYLQRRGDVTRHIRAGDEFMERGDYERASQFYGRAVHRMPANMAYLEKMRDAVSRMRPDTNTAAQTAYDLWIGTFSHEASYDSQNPEAHLRLLHELHDGARLISLVSPPGAGRRMWEQIAEAADTMYQRLPETEPKRVYGRLYRGMARVKLHAFLTDDELERAEQDLEAFVEAMPEHDLGWATLIRGKSALAEHWRVADQPRRSEARASQIKGLVAQAYKNVPNGPEVLAARALFLLGERFTDQSIPLSEVHETALRAAELASQMDEPWLLVEIAEIVQLAGVPDAAKVATGIYSAYLERHPEALAHRYFKARIQFRSNDLDGAYATAEDVLRTADLPVGLVSRMRSSLQRMAASLMVDIEHQRWAQAPEEEKPALRKAAEQARDRLLALGADPKADPDMIRADGKVALVNEDFDTAAEKFERLIRDGSNELEILAHASMALERIGQIGLAHERATAAVNNPRSSPWLTFRKGWLEFRMGRLEEASRSISRYLDRVPDDPAALELSRTIAARLSGDQAGVDQVVVAIESAHRAVQAGDYDTARATLRAAMEAVGEDDSRLLLVAARLEMLDGRPEAALPFVQRARAIRPDDPAIRQLQAILDTGDVVAAAKQFIEATQDEPAERSVALVASYRSIAEQERQRATEREAAGDAAGAAKARDIAQRASAAMNAELAVARQLAPNHPQLLETEMAEALAAKNWTRAEEIAERARQHDADQMNGLIFRGRYEYERGRFDQAVRVFQQATELRSFNSMAWRGLALSYMRLGNYREAQRAFEQAYRVNPNDITTVRQYMTMLIQMGEKTRAAQIARTAHQLVPLDIQLREVWLDLEYENGNIIGAITERRRIREQNPRDRRNLMRLAVLLGTSEPTYELIFNADGSRTYTERRWQQLGGSDQRRQLVQLRERWHAESDALVNEVAERDGVDLEVAALRATLQRMRGNPAGGERILREFIDSHDPSEQTAQMYIVLSQYQAEIGNAQTAIGSLRDAVRLQGSSPIGDIAMGNFLFNRGQYEQALAHLEKALAVSYDRAIDLRAIECYANLRQFAKAEERLAKVMAQGEMDYIIAMLQALIAHGQGEDLLAAGKATEAERRFEAQRDALATAERLMPTDPTPHLLRAQSFVQQARRTGQTRLLDDAMRALDRAEQIRPGDVKTVMARVDVHRAQGNDRTAVAELARTLERTPDNLQVRRRLVQLHMELNDRNAAIATVSQAIELYPNLPIWHELLGNLHAMNNTNLVAAAQSYRRAYELARSPALLGKYLGALLSANPPDYATASSVLRNEQAMVSAEPELGAVYAVTLFKTGRGEAGMQQMRASFQQMRAMIATGDRPPADMNLWFQAMNPLFSEQTPAVVEQAVREMADQYPSPVELAWIANYWASRGSAGIGRAIELIHEAIAAIPQENRELTASMNFELGRHALTAGQHEVMVTAFRRVVEIQPDNAIALNNLAFVMAENLKRPQEALPYARRAIELAPRSSHVLDTIGCVYYHLGDHAKASDYLTQALAIEDSALTQFHMARVLAAQGNRQEATNRLEKAKQKNPDPQTLSDINQLLDDIRAGGTGTR